MVSATLVQKKLKCFKFKLTEKKKKRNRSNKFPLKTIFVFRREGSGKSNFSFRHLCRLRSVFIIRE